jgi:hypothetical protein
MKTLITASSIYLLTVVRRSDALLNLPRRVETKALAFLSNSHFASSVRPFRGSLFSSNLSTETKTETSALYIAQLEQLASLASKDEAAVSKAEAIYGKALENKNSSNDNNILQLHNLLLSVYAYSQDPHGARNAQTLLNRMIASNTVSIDSYEIVLEALVRRRDVETMETLLATFPNDVNLTNKLIKAYSITKNVEKARHVFDTLSQPNDKSWIHVMRAYASHPANLAQVQSLYDRMQTTRADLLPVDANNALLRALSQQRGSAKKCEQLLYSMLQQASTTSVEKPNEETFFHVISAFSGETDASVSFKVGKLLQLLRATVGSVSPRAYKAAIQVISRTRDPKKAQTVRKLVQHLEPTNMDVGTRKHVLRSCACTRSRDPEDRRAAFQIAVETFNELKQQQDSSAVSLFLKATGLLPPSRKRDAVIEGVFSKCCQEGLATDFILQDFRHMASDELQLKVLGGFFEDGVKIPDEWSRNVIAKK